MAKYILAFLMLAMAGACPAEDFKDVPKNHWAAESVKMLADAGVVKGYPDKTFKGDKPVTRYELAVALQAMVGYIRASFEPVKTADAPKDPAKALKSGGYLPADSPLLKDPNKPITADQLAAALASVSTELIEQRVPAAEEPAEKR